MKTKKITIWVPRDLLENIKEYAVQDSKTVSELIESYLNQIPLKFSLEGAPIVKRLSGILSQNIEIQDHKDHLPRKYSK